MERNTGRKVKFRRSWKINPATRVKDDQAKHNRQRQKKRLKELVENAENAENEESCQDRVS